MLQKAINTQIAWFCSMNIFHSDNLISSSKDCSIKIHNNNFEIIEKFQMHMIMILILFK